MTVSILRFWRNAWGDVQKLLKNNNSLKNEYSILSRKNEEINNEDDN